MNIDDAREFEFNNLEEVIEGLIMQEPTYDVEDIDEEILQCLMYGFDEGLIHPEEYGDEWEINL